MSTFAGAADKDLIAELKLRGYRVAKADLIRTASVESTHSVHDLVRYGKEQGYIEHIRRDLGARLGVFLIQSGAIPVSEEIGEREARRYRATITVVVDDPQFDWPYPLKMER